MQSNIPGCLQLQIHKTIITGCSSELSELDSELDWNWCLENSWDSGLPERTPLCTAGCEGFLNLPLSNQQQMPQYDEPLLVLGIDLRSLENTVETSTIGIKCTCHYLSFREARNSNKNCYIRMRKIVGNFSFDSNIAINPCAKQRGQSTQNFSIRNY